MLKFSSWNTLFCDILAEAFPYSPWVLSLRDPVEVGVSLLGQPPGWMQGSDEPSRVLTRFVDPRFAWILMASSGLMAVTFYLQCVLVLRELGWRDPE